MALEVPLDRVQRWIQAVVVHPGTAEDAVKSPGAEAEVPKSQLEEVILPSRALTASERIGVYHGMYLLRMEEALASDYASLKHYLGEDAFLDLVRGYVQVYPSRSFSLNRLGDRLPEYVKTAAGLKRREFCYDLARLELAIAQVFDAPETPCLTAEEIAAVEAEAWERAQLQPVTAFQLLSFRYPVNAYLQTVRDDDHNHPKARLKDTWVAVYRRNYGVYRLDLTRTAHDLLADVALGTPLGEALTAAIRKGGRRAPGESELFQWFRQWMSGGVFRSVRFQRKKGK
jgi:hypothetical protein